jgi:hypothetical protein
MPVGVSRTRCSVQRCCAEPGPRRRHGTMRQDGPGSAAHRRRGGGARECSSPNSILKHPTHAFAFSRRISPEFCSPLRALSEQRAQGRPGAGWHPQDPRAKSIAHAMHEGDTGQPNIRPSLRNGWNGLFSALSPETNSFCLRHLAKVTDVAPVEATSHSQDLTVATTARTTRFCRTQAIPASAQEAWQGPGAVRTTRLANRSRGSAQSTAPPCNSHPRRRCSRPPQPDPRLVTTYDRPFSPDQDEQYIRQIRISVKWNILMRAD